MAEEQTPAVPDPPPPSPGARLDGWKEIAAHLGRGVRTAQRWETEYGLPVRRMGGGRAGSVYAFSREIDEWRATAAAQEAEGSIQPAGAAPLPEVRPSARTRMLRYAGPCAAAAVLAAAAWTWWPAASGRVPGPPVNWRVEADTLTTFDAAGQTSWTYQFDAALDPKAVSDPAPTTRGGFRDLDGDGRREFWFVPFPSAEPSPAARLYVFDHNGRLRWSYQHSGGVVFDGASVDGPWATAGAALTEDPADPGRVAVWVWSRSRADNPFVLSRVDAATGKPLGDPYWQGGRITTASLAQAPEGPRLVVGVTSAAYGTPGLIVLDALNIAGSWPRGDGDGPCASCPVPGEPLAAIRFPRPRRFDGIGGVGAVNRIDVGGTTAAFTAVVTFASAGPGTRADVAFRLDRGLRLLGATPAPGYVSACKALSPADRPASAASREDDPARDAFSVQAWERHPRAGRPR